MTAFIELQGIMYRYSEEALVLENLDFIFDTERIGLVGDNGSGKTTLLHLIMGLLMPLSGKILFCGKPVQSKKDWLKLRQAIGFVFQNSDDQLFMPTVIEDVAFGLLNLGMSPHKAQAQAQATLESLGIGSFAQRLTHKLSGGEKRLVALATVLAMNPQALILDEPTNDLDPETRLKLIDILRNLPQKLLVVSHDWDFLHHVVQKLAVLEHGRLSLQNLSVLHEHRHAHIGGNALHRHCE